ncbi:SRPBCC family protein [Saccharothrix coeruleofusca]|nr:SRPBCC family protein [Saccharothrix coeruleofusca]MBP2337868.1 uncharacterized protein YndB with AHSA1/START domain [Saccharothrix coeruleofusca]
MAEFEHEQKIPVQARAVFDAARDVSALDAWLPDGVQVEPSGPERVTGRVSVGDDVEEADGYFTVDEERRRLEWGDLDGEGYSGWLEVREDGPAESTAVLHLDVRGDHASAVGGQSHEMTDGYLGQALDRLAALAADRAT